MVPNWVWGVTLSFCGCLLSNFGVNVQKLGHQRLEHRNNQGMQARSIMCDPVWVAGLFCVVFGSLADLASFGFADMSLLAPLGAMTLVINMLIAPCLVKEKLTRRDIVWTFIILAGTVTSITFGNKEETSYTLKDLLEMYMKIPFIVYFCFFLLYVGGTFGALKKFHSLRLSERTTNWKRFQSFAYPSLAGAFGAHSVLFAKSAGELVMATARGENQFSNFISWAVVIMMTCSLVLQMRLLNAGLKYADALFVVPVYQVCWVIMNCVVGMVYFQDFRTMDTAHIVIFIFGVLVTLCGVYKLAQREMAQKDPGHVVRPRRASTLTVVGFHHSYDPVPPTPSDPALLADFAADPEDTVAPWESGLPVVLDTGELSSPRGSSKQEMSPPSAASAAQGDWDRPQTSPSVAAALLAATQPKSDEATASDVAMIVRRPSSEFLVASPSRQSRGISPLPTPGL